MGMFILALMAKLEVGCRDVVVGGYWVNRRSGDAMSGA